MKQSILIRWSKVEEEIVAREETIHLTFNKFEIDFHLIHNFDTFNRDILKAVDEWVKVTKNYVIEDFCEFVHLEGKNVKNLVCIPRDKWEEYEIEQRLNEK